MSNNTDLVDQLIDRLRCLPGVGPKSAQRIALHLLQRDRDAARALGRTLVQAMDNIRHCQQCRVFTESELCHRCADASRRSSQLCIVENPADMLAIERATDYRGRYFLLLGHLSPLDGIGPSDLGLDRLEQRFAADSGIDEIILALNSTVEGQATAGFIADQASRYDIPVMQIARGIPMGSELEFADGGTLAVAFRQRVPLS